MNPILLLAVSRELDPSSSPYSHQIQNSLHFSLPSFDLYMEVELVLLNIQPELAQLVNVHATSHSQLTLLNIYTYIHNQNNMNFHVTLNLLFHLTLHGGNPKPSLTANQNQGEGWSRVRPSSSAEGHGVAEGIGQHAGVLYLRSQVWV